MDDDLTAFMVTSSLSNSKMPHYMATSPVVALIPKSSSNSNPNNKSHDHCFLTAFLALHTVEPQTRRQAMSQPDLMQW